MLYSMPLNMVLKDILKCAQTTKEVRYILEKKQVLIDGVRCQEYKTPVGLFDVVSLPDINAHYRMIINGQGKIDAISVPTDEAGVKPCRVMGKTVLGKGKWQLHLSGGRNVLLQKPDYHVGDTVMLALPTQEIKQHLRFQEGMLVYLTGGKHIGETGIIEHIDGNKVQVKSDHTAYETPKHYVFVLGKEKSAITIKETKGK